MAKWIRVGAGVMHDPKVWKLAEDCGVCVAQATGHLVGVWGAMTDHAKTGDLSTVPDAALESWACWTGKRGRFAAAFRAIFLGADGVLRNWMEYNGKAIAEAEQSAKRVKAFRDKKKQREQYADGNADETPNVRVTSGERNANVLGHEDEDVTVRSTSSSSSSSSSRDPARPFTSDDEAAMHDATTLLGGSHRASAIVTRFAERVPPSMLVASWMARSTAYIGQSVIRRDGSRVKVEPHHVLMALDDHNTNNGDFAAALLTSYVQRVARGEPNPRTTAPRGKANAGDETFKNAMAAMTLRTA